MSYGKGVGYSPKISRPEFSKIKKNSTPGIAYVFLALAIIAIAVFTVLGFLAVLQWSTALIFAGICGIVFVLLFFFFGSKTPVTQSEEGTLICKKILRKKGDATGQDVVYLLIFEMQNGDEKKLNVSHHKGLYKYYREGDVVLFHPGFPYPEKYEKLFDDKVVCISCGKLTVTEEDRCRNCRLTLLK
ncbi:MAG: hypothetical protein RR992_09495 [Clostridiales bacterium]